MRITLPLAGGSGNLAHALSDPGGGMGTRMRFEALAADSQWENFVTPSQLRAKVIAERVAWIRRMLASLRRVCALLEA